MGVTILTVCHQNICRSPAMELLLGRVIHRDKVLPLSVGLVSRGLRADSKGAMCTRTTRGLVDKKELAEFVRTHRPTQLAPGELPTTALVLAAGLAERAAVVRMDVRVRERTFTMVEAARLAEHVSTTMTMPSYLRGMERLAWLVTQMDASRGTISLVPSQRSRNAVKPWQSTAVADLDLPDPHTTGGVSHRVVRARLEDATTTFGEILLSVLAGNSSMAVN